MRTLIKHILASSEAKDNLTVKGWVRTRRDSKGFSFLELNDGSSLAGLQVVVALAHPIEANALGGCKDVTSLALQRLSATTPDRLTGTVCLGPQRDAVQVRASLCTQGEINAALLYATVSMVGTHAAIVDNP